MLGPSGRKLVALVAIMAVSIVSAMTVLARDLRLATTTSTENSGLLRFLLPHFEASHDVKVRVISVGTGKALRLGENGDVDLILVHSRPDEERFIANGHGVNWRNVMHNDFVIVGPKNDPAQIRGKRDVLVALGNIHASNSLFVSRGDDSGTHKMEKRYWNVLNLNPEANPAYRSAGRGMGEVLLMASELQGYALADRATFYALKSKIDLELSVEGDRRMLNPYGVIAVNPEKFPEINFQGASHFIDWISSPAGQKIIADFRIDGEQVFFTNAN